MWFTTSQAIEIAQKTRDEIYPSNHRWFTHLKLSLRHFGNDRNEGWKSSSQGCHDVFGDQMIPWNNPIWSHYPILIDHIIKLSHYPMIKSHMIPWSNPMASHDQIQWVESKSGIPWHRIPWIAGANISQKRCALTEPIGPLIHQKPHIFSCKSGYRKGFMGISS